MRPTSPLDLYPSRVRSRRGALRPLLLGALLPLVALVPACGSADGATTPASGETPVPAALVGTWRVVAAAGGQVCDDLGHCSGSDGGSESYAFTADGHFEFTQYLVSNLLGCRIVATLYAKGTMTVAGARMTLTPTYAHQGKQATCESSFERDVTIDPTPYSWRLAADAAGHAQLYVIGAAGTDGPFDRVP